MSSLRRAIMAALSAPPPPTEDNFTDFSGYSTGVAPSDWTPRWVTTGVVYSVETVGSGNVLRVDVTSGGERRIISWDQCPETTDVEVLARVRATAAPAAGQIGPRLVARAKDTGLGNQQGYALQLRSSPTQMEVFRFNDAGTATEASFNYPWTVNDWYWMRLRVVGNSIRGKVWPTDTIEPSNWRLDFASSTITDSGHVAVGGQTVDVECDYFSFDDEGGTAPGAEIAITQQWDPDVVSIPSILSEGNKRLTANTAFSGSYANSRGRLACIGKCYFSVELGFTASGSVLGAGVADATTDLTGSSNYPGMDNKSIEAGSPNGSVFFNGASIGSVGTMATVDAVEVAVDVDTRQVWLRQSGGAWAGGGDPAAGTSPTATLSGTGKLYPAVWVSRTSATSARYARLHCTAGEIVGTPPSGFTAANWETPASEIGALDVEILSDAPWAYWKLDETSGATSYADSSGNSRALSTLTSTLVPETVGIVSPGTCVDFTSGYIRSASNEFGAAQAAAFGGDKSFTVVMCVDADSLSGNPVAIHLGTVNQSGSQGFLIQLRENGVLRFQLYTSAWIYCDSPAGTIEAGNTYIIHARRELGGSYSVWIDGVRVGALSSAGSVSASATTGGSGSRIALGCLHGNTPSNILDGRLQHVAVFEYPLSEGRIRAHAQAAGLLP